MHESKWIHYPDTTYHLKWAPQRFTNSNKMKFIFSKQSEWFYRFVEWIRPYLVSAFYLRFRTSCQKMIKYYFFASIVCSRQIYPSRFGYSVAYIGSVFVDIWWNIHNPHNVFRCRKVLLWCCKYQNVFDMPQTYHMKIDYEDNLI